MGIINCKIDDSTEKQFRKVLSEVKGYKKGAMGEAVTEALELWIKANSQ